MTIPDLIDECLREIGASEQSIVMARESAIALYTGSTLIKRQRLYRELSDEEITHYKAVILIYFAAIISDPEFRNKIKANMETKLHCN